MSTHTSFNPFHGGWLCGRMLFKQSGPLMWGLQGPGFVCVSFTRDVYVCLAELSGHGNNGPLECEVTGALTPGK